MLGFMLQEALVNIPIAGLGLLLFRLCAGVWRKLYTGNWAVPGLLAVYLCLMYAVTGGKINPLIGSAGVSAVPMAARVSQVVGQKEDPSNFLLMHAMGPNVAGVIGSAVAAGVFLALFQ